MVAYNFMRQFAGAVENNEKIHTVRANGKRRHAQAGDMLQLYTGMRTKDCRLLKEVPCIGSWPVYLPVHPDYGPLIWSINHHSMDTRTMDEFARNDGFGGALHFAEWILETHGSEFSGTLIAWKWVSYLPALTAKGAGLKPTPV